MKFFLKILCLINLGFFAAQGFALPAQILIVPECLLTKKFHYEFLGQEKDLVLIKTAQFKEFQTARIKPPAFCSGFLNVTEAWHLFPGRKNKKASSFLQKYLPERRPSDFARAYKIQNQTKVNELFQKIDATQVWSNLTFLAGFKDRYINSNSGVYAAKWLKQQLKEMAITYEREDVAIFFVPTINHGRQPSVVLKIGKDLTSPGLIIGTHFDTIDSTHSHQPGANKAASGVATTMEAARILLASKIAFNKPIYFIWYAGEEAGRLGSQSILQYFNRNGIEIDSVLQLKETGFTGKELGIGLTDDYSDAGLTAFVADLVGIYLHIPAGAVRCGYACSDHMLWYQNGNRVAYPFTTIAEEGSPYAHTSKDSLETVSLDHVINFVRLSIAFVVELSV